MSNQQNFYVIDTSSLIDLNIRYPIDVFPSLWKKVEELINRGYLISHKEVLKEVCNQDDSLKKWALKQKNFFREVTLKQAKIVKEILKKYPSLAKPKNENGAADPFVIALAAEIGEAEAQQELFSTIKKRLIVTQEKLRGNKVKIPFVCKDYNIDCIDIVEMYRIEGWKF
ncbi:MAG: DUF4411 family protein [Nanoarchaeota archaeon]|nr:DUF4411 family protein [Nanoarchaeota archaeon]